MLKYLLAISIPFACFADDIDTGDELYDQYQRNIRTEIEGLQDLRPLEGKMYSALNKFVFYWQGHYWIINSGEHFKFCDCGRQIK